MNAYNLLELNLVTLNKLLNDKDSIQEIQNVKDPKDILAIQTNLAKKAVLETLKYAQQASVIWMDVVAQSSHIFTDTLYKSNKAVDFVSKDFKNKEKSWQEFSKQHPSEHGHHK